VHHELVEAIDSAVEECERDYDIILVPGGISTQRTMEDADTSAR